MAATGALRLQYSTNESLTEALRGTPKASVPGRSAGCRRLSVVGGWWGQRSSREQGSLGSGWAWGWRAALIGAPLGGGWEGWGSCNEIITLLALKWSCILIFRWYSCSYPLATWARLLCPVAFWMPYLNRCTYLQFLPLTRVNENFSAWICPLLALQLSVIGSSIIKNEMLVKPACFYSQKDEPDAFKELGTGNRIATWLFYVSDTFLPCAFANKVLSLHILYSWIISLLLFKLKWFADEGSHHLIVTNTGTLPVSHGSYLCLSA